MGQAQSDQTINGFNRVNGVSACNGNACRSANRLATVQNLANHAQWQHIDGHAHQCQSHDRLSAHGVHIGDGVGGCNATKLKGVVDDGHEEVSGGHQGLAVVQLVNGGIVRRFNAHQQFGWQGHGCGGAQNFAQNAGCNFAAATPAMRQAGQTRAGFEILGHADSQ